MPISIVEPSVMGVKSYNDYQEQFFEQLLEEGPDNSYLVGFRPGAGKTIMSAAYIRYLKDAGIASSFLLVAPFRALSSQLNAVLGALDAAVGSVECVLGGDDAEAPLERFRSGETQVLVCTPEVAVLKVLPVAADTAVIIDEVHMRYDPSRGWLYDVLLRAANRSPMLAMSGTLGTRAIKALTAYPRQRGKHVIVTSNDSNRTAADLRIFTYEGHKPPEARVAGLLLKSLEDNEQVLCFVASKKYGYDLMDTIIKRSPTTTVGFHNADLDQANREKVENLFLEGRTKILIHTQTLVTGVDFDVTAGVVAQVRTGMGEVPIYDIIQAISRVGRRRPGVCRVLIPEKWDADDYVSRLDAMDCGYPPTIGSVEPWTAHLWAAWAIAVGTEIPGMTRAFREEHRTVRSKLGPSIYQMSMNMGLSPLTARQYRGALRNFEVNALADGKLREDSDAYLAANVACSLYPVSEVSATVRFPTDTLSKEVARCGDFRTAPGADYRAHLAEAIYRVMRRGSYIKPTVSHQYIYNSVRNLVSRISPIGIGYEAATSRINAALGLSSD